MRSQKRSMPLSLNDASDYYYENSPEPFEFYEFIRLTLLL